MNGRKIQKGITPKHSVHRKQRRALIGLLGGEK
jgi:hypothetical protein